MSKYILCIIGASGSGKTTISNLLQNEGIPNLVSFTTRNRRRGEHDGIDYYFYTKEQLKDVALVEETTYDGNIYGLTGEEIDKKLAENDIVSVVIDYPGALVLKELYPQKVVLVNLLVDEETIRERMQSRGDAPESINKRIKHAYENNELLMLEDADFYVENEDIDKTLETMMDILEILR